ncbi:Regulation of nuclear pre-mRNA domain-containing protein 2 [Taenia crassiceps]|uniref:Regulation of nuclear pre-mRNA domain-containing protein 2 n=1 Tax=Taenia crassiceps TaxID=6207 RepID=A0ABR4QKG4_9CEST
MPEHADLIAKLWLRAFRSATEPASQLALLYVLNEIILKCASYGTPEIKNSFKDPIVDALKVLRPGLLMRKVKKLLLMWSERGLFDQQFNKQMLQLTGSLAIFSHALSDNFDKHSDHKVGNMESDGATGNKDFSPDILVNQLQGFKQMDEAIKTFSEADLIPSSFHLPIETILYRIKSKEEGQSFSQQVSTCASQLEDALNNMNRKLSAQEALSKNIDKAILFYSTQEKEAGLVVNAYKSYEQQVRNTLRTLLGGDWDGADRSPVTFEMAIEDDNAESVTASSQQNTSEQPTCLEGHDEAGDGVSDMSEDEEDEGTRTSFIIRSHDTSTTRDVHELLVDPKSLAHFPFSDEIIIDDKGDVDYRPMFNKMLSCECYEKMKGAPGKSAGGISCTNKDAKGDDAVVESANVSDEDVEVDMEKSSVVDASALTETGDFDYRQSTFGSGETERDRQSSVSSRPLGLGGPITKNQDADLRLLLPSASEPPHSAVDSDYRQLCVSSSLQLPSASSSFPWLDKGDCDLRQSQAATAAVAASAIANAVAVQSLLLTSTPTLPSEPLFAPIVATPTASILPQHQPFSNSVTAPISLYRQKQNQRNASASISSASFSQQSQRPPVLVPVSDLQQAYQPATSTSSAPTHFNLSASNDAAAPSHLISGSTQDSRQGDAGTGKCRVAGPQDEDPFTIISRLTGLSNLIQSVKPTSTCAPSQSVSAVTPPPNAEKSSMMELQTPNYSDNLSEEEVENAVSKTASPVSSPRPPSPALGAAVSGENLEQSEDGGATPTQDESGTSSDAVPGSNCFTFPQTGLGPNVLTQATFPPLVPPNSMHSPPLAGASNNLLLPFPLGMPPFNPMGVGPSPAVQPPWHTTTLPTNCPNLGGKPLPPQAFFPIFPPVVSQSPFTNLPTNQSIKLLHFDNRIASCTLAVQMRT